MWREAIRSLRQERSLSATYISTEIGCSKQYITSIELGKSSPMNGNRFLDVLKLLDEKKAIPTKQKLN